MDNSEIIKELYLKWISKQASPVETEQLFMLLGSDAETLLEPYLRERWDHQYQVFDYPESLQQRTIDNILNNYPASDDSEHPGTIIRPPMYRRTWFRYAAAIFLLAGIGFYYWTRDRSAGQKLAEEKPKQEIREIPPGKNGAMLTLADGTSILLDTVQNGIVALQGGSKARLVNGQLMYEGQSSEMLYNTMSTPYGKQFSVTLPDGSMVWLNAASSLTYPITFTGRERRVSVRGEAYFEVAKNATMPFIVKADDRAEIEVLGTRFNVNAYENEKSLNTTLLEGSVKVNNMLLRPGEQARVTDKVELVRNVNTEKVIAWKNGYFNFEGSDLKEMMRQLERWYNVSVKYENGIPDIKLEGEMSKDIPLTKLLEVLNKMPVEFTIQADNVLLVRRKK